MEAVKPLVPEENQEEKQLTPLERLQEMTDIIQKESDHNFRKYEAFLKRIRKKEKISAEEIMQQKESWDMIKNMQKCREALYKICFPKGQKPSETNYGANLGVVKQETSTIGAIQREIPKM